MRTFLILFLSSLMFISQGPAQADYIDSVIAIVEDDIITNSELREEINRIREDLASQGRSLPTDNSLNRQVLELMINRSILLQEAKSRGVKITETQLNNAMQNLAARNNTDLAGFRDLMDASGVNFKDFRERVRREMVLNTIKNSYARQSIDITDQEVDDFIRRNGADANSIEYRLSHILIALPDGASPDQINTAQQKADDLKAKLDQGDDFTALAIEFSESSDALEGGDLGWRKLAELPGLFADLTLSMKKGEAEGPIRSANGFHLVYLADKRDSEQVIIEQTEVRHILIRPDTLTTDAEAEQKAQQLRRQIIEQQADFAELAKKNSDDPGSKGLGGSLGWVDPGTMVTEFEQMMQQTAVGEISPVFKTQFGWHFLQVQERREVDETDESKRKKIRAQLENQKKQEVLELWQRKLRDEAFVKIVAQS